MTIPQTAALDTIRHRPTWLTNNALNVTEKSTWSGRTPLSWNVLYSCKHGIKDSNLVHLNIRNFDFKKMFRMDIISNVITIPQYRCRLHHQAVLALCEVCLPCLSICLLRFWNIFRCFFMVAMKIKLVSTHNWACLSVLQEMYRWTWAWFVPYMDSQTRAPPTTRLQKVYRFRGSRSKLEKSIEFCLY